MATLPVDFLDDILNASMNGKRKYRITHADGSTEEVILEDVSEYDQVGSNFGAAQVNQTNEAVNEKLESADVVDPMVATEEGFAADAKLTGDALSELNKNIGFGHVVEIVPYNAVFGSVAAYGTSGVKTFTVTPSESVVAKMQKYIDAGYKLYGRILGGTGQYGAIFSYNIDNTALNNGETTFEISLNAVSYSNASHTLSMLVHIAIMCEK